MSQKLDITDEQVKTLAQRFWKKTEIAALFGCDEATIRKRFKDAYEAGVNCGKGKLRDMQLKAATEGNPTMLIWLGKQFLAQTDKIEQKGDRQNVNVTWVVDGEKISPTRKSGRCLEQ